MRARYESNYARLLEGLRAALAGCRDVYTHNPWGEYGHAEHIQVYDAVSALQEEIGYTVWYSNYVGTANWTFAKGLAERLSWSRRSVAKPDIATARKLMRVYRRYGAWTYTLAHRWPRARSHVCPATREQSRRPTHRYPGNGCWMSRDCDGGHRGGVALGGASRLQRLLPRDSAVYTWFFAR